MLSLEDGFPNQRSRSRSEVAHLQRLLNVSLSVSLKIDGYFGTLTEDAVKQVQAEHATEQDGVVDDALWQALEQELSGVAGPELAAVRSSTRTAMPPASLPGFRGDLGWIHEQEGHAGRPYWPGGSSGVTLDPGYDLAHQTFDTTRSLYGPVVSTKQLQALKGVLRKTGREAKVALNRDPILISIRISRAHALAVMPTVAEPYWGGICGRFPILPDEATPRSVQTALLSLAYNRGFNNPDLEQLAAPLAAREWQDCGRRVAAMQQDHDLSGIRLRRQREARIIFGEISN